MSYKTFSSKTSKITVIKRSNVLIIAVSFKDQDWLFESHSRHRYINLNEFFFYVVLRSIRRHLTTNSLSKNSDQVSETSWFQNQFPSKQEAKCAKIEAK